MSDRITTTCQHTHTVTLRLNEGEWGSVALAEIYPPSNDIAVSYDGTWWSTPRTIPPAIRAELEAALAAAEASCGGCGCAERPRAEGWRRFAASPEQHDWYMDAADFLDAAPGDQPPTTCHCGQPFAYGYDGDPTHHRGMCARCDAVRCDAYPGACEDAAQDARGSDLSAEQGEEEQ